MSGMLGGANPQQLMQMLSQGRADPFSRPLPGTGLMGDGNLAPPMPQMPQMPQQPGLNQMGPMSQMGQEMNPPDNFSSVPTDFANTQPGLPNLPDSFKGFGFGQFAPQEVQPMGLRQQYIKQLLGQFMPQMPGGGF